jgi:hypothetical protein
MYIKRFHHHGTFFFIFISMGKFVNKRDYESFIQSLKGPLKSLKGEIYETKSETFNIYNCYLNVVIREREIGPDLISKLLTEIAGKFKPMYDLYMDEHGSGMAYTDVRIMRLYITGGLDSNDIIGINLNDTMTTVLPVEKQLWIKEMYSVDQLLSFPKTPESIQQTQLDETTVEKINRSLRQLQSQKNVPHNLQVHLDFIEEGNFNLDISYGEISNEYNVYYKLPEDIKLKFDCDPTNHNKITGVVDFAYKPIYIEFPVSPEVGKSMRDSFTSLLTAKIKKMFKSNDLVPTNFAGNTSNFDRAIFNFNFKWTG